MFDPLKARFPGAMPVLVAMGLLPAVSLAESPLHVAAGGGVTRFHVRCDGDACDRHDGGWRLAAGWAINDRWSVEALWIDAGRFVASDVTSTGTPFFGRADVSAYGATLAYSWSFGGRFALDAKLGVASVDADFSPGPAPAIAGGRSVTRPIYGVTGRWRVTPRWSFRADWDGTAGRMNRYDGRVDLVAVGIQYDF